MTSLSFQLPQPVRLPGSADLTIEARVYQLAAGRGYASLYAHDADLNAILLEHLGPSLANIVDSIEDQIRQICATLQDAWVPLDESCGLMTGAEKARWLMAFITEKWQLLDRPCDKATVDRAISFADARAVGFC